jgi:hypothetical protein
MLFHLLNILTTAAAQLAEHGCALVSLADISLPESGFLVKRPDANFVADLTITSGGEPAPGEEAAFNEYLYAQALNQLAGAAGIVNYPQLALEAGYLYAAIDPDNAGRLSFAVAEAFKSLPEALLFAAHWGSNGLYEVRPDGLPAVRLLAEASEEDRKSVTDLLFQVGAAEGCIKTALTRREAALGLAVDPDLSSKRLVAFTEGRIVAFDAAALAAIRAAND